MGGRSCFVEPVIIDYFGRGNILTSDPHYSIRPFLTLLSIDFLFWKSWRAHNFWLEDQKWSKRTSEQQANQLCILANHQAVAGKKRGDGFGIKTMRRAIRLALTNIPDWFIKKDSFNIIIMIFLVKSKRVNQHHPHSIRVTHTHTHQPHLPLLHHYPLLIQARSFLQSSTINDKLILLAW